MQKGMIRNIQLWASVYSEKNAKETVQVKFIKDKRRIMKHASLKKPTCEKPACLRAQIFSHNFQVVLLYFS